MRRDEATKIPKQAGDNGGPSGLPDRFVTLTPCNETVRGPEYGETPASRGEVPKDNLNFLGSDNKE